jgi:hypothetical protein
MICLRCGYCCIHLDVIIVDEPSSGIIMENLVHKPSGIACKHLVGSPGNYSCMLHDLPWFYETPCADFTQIEIENCNCRLGVMTLNTNHV